MVWKVFCEYEAVDYPEGGKEAFYQAIHSEEYLAMLEVYGALCDEKIVGIMAIHSSLYAAEIYKKLGFYQTDSIKEDGGIQYIPMEYNVLE